MAESHPRLQAAAREAIGGQRRGFMAVLPFLGPAFIASIAYIDPGNFATNIQGGAQFGYALLWVVLMANLMAMLLQALSAKLGIATGKNLAEMCRIRFCTFLWGWQQLSREYWFSLFLQPRSEGFADWSSLSVGQPG